MMQAVRAPLTDRFGTTSETGETVEEHWEQAVTNERPGPPVDGATPDSDMVEAPEGEQ